MFSFRNHSGLFLDTFFFKKPNEYILVIWDFKRLSYHLSGVIRLDPCIWVVKALLPGALVGILHPLMGSDPGVPHPKSAPLYSRGPRRRPSAFPPQSSSAQISDSLPDDRVGNGSWLTSDSVLMSFLYLTHRLWHWEMWPSTHRTKYPSGPFERHYEPPQYAHQHHNESCRHYAWCFSSNKWRITMN